MFRLLCFYSAHWAYSPDSSLRRHDVLSETQQFWPCGACINLSGGAVSSHKRSAEAGAEMRRRFSRDVGSRWWCTSAAGTATPEAERFRQSTIDPAGRRGGPGSTGSNEAARQLHNRRRWCTSAAGTPPASYTTADGGAPVPPVPPKQAQPSIADGGAPVPPLPPGPKGQLASFVV